MISATIKVRLFLTLSLSFLFLLFEFLLLLIILLPLGMIIRFLLFIRVISEIHLNRDLLAMNPEIMRS
jgi:hypothetical protein